MLRISNRFIVCLAGKLFFFSCSYWSYRDRGKCNFYRNHRRSIRLPFSTYTVEWMLCANKLTTVTYSFFLNLFHILNSNFAAKLPLCPSHNTALYFIILKNIFYSFKYPIRNIFMQYTIGPIQIQYWPQWDRKVAAI